MWQILPVRLKHFTNFFCNKTCCLSCWIKNLSKFKEKICYLFQTITQTHSIITVIIIFLASYLIIAFYLNFYSFSFSVSLMLIFEWPSSPVYVSCYKVTVFLCCQFLTLLWICISFTKHQGLVSEHVFESSAH